MSRAFRSKFQQPFELDLQAPLKGINYIAPVSAANPDFNYCRGSTNMWLSPEGYVETRPGMTRLNGELADIISGPVCGMYYSLLWNGLFYVSGHVLYFINKDKSEQVAMLEGHGNGVPVSFTDFMGKTYLVWGNGLWYVGQHYDSESALMVWDLTQQQSAVDTVPIPNLTFITQWKERLWGFVDERVYGGGYRTADDWGPIHGDVTTSLGGYLDVRPGDGTKVSALCVYQGGFYCTKADEDGIKVSFWEIGGSSFRPDSSDPFSLRLINDGVGCVNPFTMLPVLNTVLFAGNAYSVFSVQTVKEASEPLAVPQNETVRRAMSESKAICATYQPYMGYYFLLHRQGSTGYNTCWCYHAQTGGWWRWNFVGVRPVWCCTGPERLMFFGDDMGFIYRLSDFYGVDDLPNGRKYQYVSGLSTQILAQQYVRDKYFEWLYLSYAPLGPKGRMAVSFNEGVGYTYAYTVGRFSEGQMNEGGPGWDDFASQWDSETVGWDMGAITVERRCRIGRRNQTIQITVNASTPFRFLTAHITGGIIAQGQRGWAKG